MTSTDLESYKVEDVEGRKRSAVWTDRVEKIRRDVSLDTEYQQGHTAALAVSCRLLVQHEFDTLFYLWDKYGIPYEFNLIIEEISVDAGKNKKKIFERIQENEEVIKEAYQRLQEGITLLRTLERKQEALKSIIGDFQKDERYYATKR